MRVTLTISVTAIEFDINASTLRINGRNVEENRFVKLGAFHTVDLELNQKFSLYKAEWDSIALERIENACDVTRTADVAAVVRSCWRRRWPAAVRSKLTHPRWDGLGSVARLQVLQEGLAHVCLITPNMTIVRQRIEVAIAKKRRGDVTQHEKGMQRYAAVGTSAGGARGRTADAPATPVCARTARARAASLSRSCRLCSA